MKPGPKPRPPVARFWPRVNKDGPAGCWLWLGGTDQYGYGSFGATDNKTTKAHRFAYELLVGPIPTGLVIDHLCRQPSCVNPAHMEVVTQAENVRRGHNVGGGPGRPPQERCDRGHAMDTLPGGRRVCRPCARARDRAYRERRRLSAVTT